MARSTFEKIRAVYICFCVTVTIGCSLWAVIVYQRDEDLTNIQVKPFNGDAESIYPSITLFFYSPIPDQVKLKKYGVDLTASRYKKFLQGDEWSDDLMSVNYDDVTLNIMDYFIEYHVEYDDGNYFLFRKSTPDHRNGWKAPYSAGNVSVGKAFTIDIPFERNRKVRAVNIKLKTAVFPNQLRPHQVFPFSGFNGFGVYFHYPGQLWRDKHFRKMNWPVRTKNSSKTYYMQFEIQNIEIMQNRNKRNTPCLDGILDLDRIHFESVAKRLPCKPPYFNIGENTTACKSRKEMEQCHSLMLSYNLGQYLKHPPCRSLEKLEYNYMEFDLREADPPFVHIDIRFIDATYREILRVRAFTIESLLGNIGGYIGIFIGYSIFIHLPDAAKNLYKWIRQFADK